MKVVNVVLCVLTLLLAVASAVFSYFLFDKRGQMISGWSKMAQAVEQTAAAMDKNSGTKLATELGSSALGHENFAELDKKLPQLSTQASQLVTERDALSDALRRIAASVDMKNIGDDDAFRNLATYSTNKDDVINAVGDAIKKRNDIIKALVDAAQRIGVRLDADALKAGKVDALKELDNKLASIRNQQMAFESHLREIGSNTGAGGLVFSDDSYKDSLSKAVGSVRDLKKNYDDSTRAVDQAKQQIRGLEGKVRDLDGKIAVMNKRISDKDEQLNSLKKALGMSDSDELPAPWLTGSKEARAAVVGKVVAVNKRYGFIAINIGKDTMVEQPIGNKKAQINPQITEGMDMLVARGSLDSDDCEFIANVKLTKVDGDCSIAEIPADGPNIKVGDIAFFAEAKKK